jgi:hypothetical protein
MAAKYTGNPFEVKYYLTSKKCHNEIIFYGLVDWDLKILQLLQLLNRHFSPTAFAPGLQHFTHLRRPA